MPENRRTTRTQNVQLPPVGEYVKNLEALTEQSIAICALRSTTVRIPAAIRTQMRALPRLMTFWSQNRTAYTGLVEAASQQPKTRTAGA